MSEPLKMNVKIAAPKPPPKIEGKCNKYCCPMEIDDNGIMKQTGAVKVCVLDKDHDGDCYMP